MLTIFSAKLNSAVSIAAICLCCILCFTGCTESRTSVLNEQLLSNNPDLDFETHKDLPPTPMTLYSISNILASQGRDSDCELLLKRIIKEQPGFMPAYSSLAQLQMRHRRVNEAIETLSKAVQIAPRDTVLLNNLGVCQIVKRDYEAALASFTAAAGISPENARYRANMALALGMMNRDEESLALFKQILPEEKANDNLNVIRAAVKKSKPNASM